MTARPILVGTDGSDTARRAVAWAAREAATHGKPLLIVAALAPPPRLSSPWSAAAIQEAAQRRAEQALAAAAGQARDVAPAVRMAAEMLAGEPAQVLTARAAEASMLVVGSRGTGGLAPMALGSVSRYTATHATCPVVVVRADRMAPHLAPQLAAHREVVVGVRDPDLPGSSAALGFAFEEAALRAARLLAVHAWYWPAPAGHLDQPGAPRHAAHRMADALCMYQEKYPDVAVVTDVARAHPGRVLAGASARADLVVVGRHDAPVASARSIGARSIGARSIGARDIGARDIGSVTDALLRHGHGPVAIVANP
ncbi:MAG TPA: universal stress protein [Streptosporangiaceae bacterium]|jgi:nucleotide-binding universal stress UspA family protein